MHIRKTNSVGSFSYAIAKVPWRVFDNIQNRFPGKSRFRFEVLSFKLLSFARICLLPFAICHLLHANPTGGQVAAGSASIQNSGSTCTINQSTQRVVINWQDFSIGSGELTQFLQPNSAAAALNRVTSGAPSSILGTLQANGHVYIINPNGVFIGSGASINVNSLVMSTLDIPNTSFMNGDALTFTGTSKFTIKNDGTINALGGDVYLLAYQVENNGTILAPQGNVGLAAGCEILLVPSDNQCLAVKTAVGSQPSAVGTGVNNQGLIAAASAELKAADGNVYALAINNGGAVRATGTATRNGKLWLVSDGGTISSSGTLKAQNANGSGGAIVVSSQKQGESRTENGVRSATLVSGTVDASGLNANGGQVQLTGDHVGLMDGAKVDVSAYVDSSLILHPSSSPMTANAGTALIGGDYKGQNPDVYNASATYVAPTAEIHAAGASIGNGGKVIVWSDDATMFYGNITAKGGLLGGDGGFVETSGKNFLEAWGSVNASASAGLAGLWYLDPRDVTITNITGGGAFGGGNPNVFTPTANNATVDVATINGSLNGGTSVTVTTGGTGVQAGNITVAGNINKTAGGDATLLLQAANDIFVNANVSIGSTSNKLNVTFNADWDASNAGAITMNSGSSITTNGGNIIFGGGAVPATTPVYGTSQCGINLITATLNAGTGNITMRGVGSAVANGYGILLNNSSLTSNGGTITLVGVGGAGSGSFDIGVYLSGASTVVQNSSGPISITGTSNAVGGSNHYGILMDGGARVLSTGAGAINMNGTGAASGVDQNLGIYMLGAGTRVESSNTGSGAISITGVGNGTGATNFGIELAGGASIQSNSNNASATITIDGTGSGTGTNQNYGVYVTGAGSCITTVAGNIDLTGAGSGSGVSNNNYGIFLNSGGSVISTGSANIAMTATAPNTSTDAMVVGAGACTIGGTGDVGSIFIKANRMNLDASLSIRTTGTVTLTPYTIGQYIWLGAGDDPTALGLSNSEINTVQAGTLNIGDVSLYAGTITVKNNLTVDGNKLSNLNLISGFDITFNTNYTLIASGGAVNVTLNADRDGGGAGSPGGVVMNMNSGINSNGGDIIIGGGIDPLNTPVYGSTFDGVYMNGVSLVSGGGDISIRGTGKNVSNANGLWIFGNTSISGGTGDITLVGTGSAGANYDCGIGLDGASTIVQTKGTITVIGTGGGTTGYNRGVVMTNGATIKELGANSISITGTGSGVGAQNYGVYLSSGSAILSTISSGTSGSITINATAAPAGNTTDAFIMDSGTTNLGGVSNSGDITINANRMNFDTGQAIYTTGTVTLAPKTVGRTVNIGGVDDASNLGLSVTELGKITANTLIIGDAITGTVTQTASFTFGSSNLQNVITRSRDDIIINANQTLTVTVAGGVNFTFNSDRDGNGDGAFVMNSGAGITSNGGNITICGDTDGSGAAQGTAGHLHGVSLATSTSLLSGSGNITIRGMSQGGAAVDNAHGADLWGLIESSSGAISITGMGGAGRVGIYGIQNRGTIRSATGSIFLNGVGGSDGAFGSPGMYLSSTSSIISTDTATITINGTGTVTGVGCNGIEIAGATVQSVNGNITIIGNAGGTQDGWGLKINSGATIASTGNAQISLTGVAPNGTFDNLGVYLYGAGTKVTSQTGAITINGTGAGSGAGNYGVYITTDADVLSTGSAPITINATAANNSTTALYMTDNNTVIGGALATGNITLRGDRISIDSAQDIRTTGIVTITPKTVNREMRLGVNDAVGYLGLVNTEINKIYAGTIRFGDANTGTLTIQIASIAPSGTNTVHLTSGTGGIVATTAGITISNLAVTSDGAIDMSYASSSVGTLAVSTSNDNFTFVNSGALIIGSVDGVTGINVGSGTVTLTAAGLTQNQIITAGSLGINSTAAVTLNSGNQVGTLAVDARNLGVGQTVTFTDASDLTVGVVGAITGITSGALTLIADNMDISAAITADGQTVLLDPYTAGRQVDIGTNTAGKLSLIDGEIDQITVHAGTLIIGGLTTGTVTVSAATTPDGTKISNYALRSKDDIIFSSGATMTAGGGAVNVTLNSDRDANGSGAIVMNSGSGITSNDGNIVLGGGANPGTTAAMGNGVNLNGIKLDNVSLTSGAGDITLRGQGMDGTTSAHGIYTLTGTWIQSAAGTITVVGTGGTGTSSNDGIYMNGGSILSTAGSISVSGTGKTGTSTLNDGLLMANGASISSTANAAAAKTVSVTGVGGGTGAGQPQNRGIVMSGASSISSQDSAVTINGTGGSGNLSYGLSMLGASSIVSSGTATLNIIATGGGTSGTSTDVGLIMNNSSIQSTTGTIDITATGNGDAGNNYGLLMQSSAAITSNGAANINVTATAGSSSFDAIVLSSGNTVIGGDSNLGNNVTLMGDRINLASAQAIIADGIVTLSQKTNGQAIDLGAADAAGTLGLTAAELNKVTAGTLSIGNASSGAITVSSAIAPASASTLHLTSGSTISESAGGTITVNNLAVTATSGATTMTQNNDVGVLAVSATGRVVSYKDVSGFTIGTVDGVVGATAGTLTLNAGGAVDQAALLAGAIVTTTGLELLGGADYTLNTSTANNISMVAGNVGALILEDDNGFIVGSVGSTNGITASKSVTLQALGAVGTNPTIMVQNDIIKNAGNDAVLTIQANNLVKVMSGADITSTHNKLDVILNGDRDANGRGNIELNAGTIITSNDGKIVLGGGNGNPELNGYARGVPTDPIGVNIDGAQLQSGAGNITIRGQGAQGANGMSGVVLSNGTLVQSTSGNITVVGIGGNGTDSNKGVFISGATETKITSATGNISVTGTGAGTTFGNYGVYLAMDAKIESTGSASISIDATGANGAAGLYTSVITDRIGGGSNTGNITITTDSIDLPWGLVQSTGGSLVIQPKTVGTTIGLGDGSAGTLNLSATELGRLSDGFSSITIGRNDGGFQSGAVDVRAVSLSDPLQILNGVNGIAINGALNIGNNALTLNTGGAIATGALGSVVATGAVSLTTGAAALTLDSISNQLGAIAISGSPTSVTITEDHAITQNGDWSLGAAALTLKTQNGQNITLNSGNNVFGDLKFTAGNGTVFIQEAGSMVLTNSQGGAVSLTTTGAGHGITGGTVTATTGLTLSSTGAIGASAVAPFLTETSSLIASVTDAGAGIYIKNTGSGATILGAIATHVGDGGDIYVKQVGAGSLTLSTDILSPNGNVTIDNTVGVLNIATHSVQAPNSSDGNDIMGNPDVVNLGVVSANGVILHGNSGASGTLDWIITSSGAIAPGIHDIARDIIIDNNVTVTVVGDITLNSDSDSSGTGGFWIRPGGSLEVTGRVIINGSSIFNGASGAIYISNNGNNAALSSTSDMTLLSNYAGSDFYILGNISLGTLPGDGVGHTITLDPVRNVYLGATVDTHGGNVIFGDTHTSAVQLSNASIVNATGGATFASTIDGAQTLDISAGGAGSVTFNGSVGSITPVSSLTVTAGTLTVNNNCSILSSGAVGITGALALGGDTTVRTSDANISITGAVTGSHALTLWSGSSAVSLGGDVGTVGAKLTSLNITATGGPLSEGAHNWFVSGTTTLDVGSGNNITLDQAGNDFGTVVVTSGNTVALKDANTIDLGASTISGDFNVTSVAGNITDSGTVGVVGSATFIASNSTINLNTLAVGGSIYLTDPGVAGHATIVNAAGLDLGVSTVGGNLSVTATTGNITNSGAVSAGGNLTGVTSAANATIALGGGGHALSVTGQFDLSTNGAAGNATINNTSAVDFAASEVGGNLTVTANGPITQTGGRLTVDGTSSFIAGANAITLTQAANAFTGAVDLSNNGANDVAVRTSGAMVLGAVNVGRDLVVTGVGITQNNTMTVGGAATFNGNAGVITLTQNNDFQSTVSLNNTGANDVRITDINSVQFAASNIGSGAFTVNAVGVTQTGGVVQEAGAGTVTVNGGAGVITLTHANNDFKGSLVLNNAGANDVQVCNSTAVDLAASSVGRDLTVIATTGNMTDSGTVTVAGNLTATTSQANATIDLGTLAVAGSIGLNTSGVTGHASVVNAAGVDLAVSNVNGNLSATATTGNTTDSGIVTVSGNAVFTTSASDATINLGTLAVTGSIGLNTSGTTGHVTLVNATGVDLSVSNVHGNLDATATTGNMTDSGLVTVSGNAVFTTSGANATINMNTLSVAGSIGLNTSGVTGHATIVNATGVDLAVSNVHGNLNTTATTGNMTDSGLVTVSGNAAFTTSTANATITLDTLAVTGTLGLNTSGATGNATISTTGVDFATSSVGGALDVTTTVGGITQTGGALTVGGTTRFDAANGITLLDASNDFSGAVSLNSDAGAVSLRNANALVLGTSNVAGGALTVIAGGSISQTGAITQAGGAVIFDVRAAVSDITLDQANDFGGAVTLDGSKNAAGGGGQSNLNDATLRNINAAAALPTISNSGGDLHNLTLTFNNAAIALPAVSVTNDLTVTAGGNITQTGNISVAGTASFNAGVHDITLGNANSFDAGNLSLTGVTVTVTENSASNLAGVNATTFFLTSSGAITDSGSVIVSGVSTLDAGTNDITLDTATNNFGTVVTSNTANLTLVDVSGIDLGATTLSGALSVTAGGAITNSGILTVPGTASFVTQKDGGADITITTDPILHSDNLFTGSITARSLDSLGTSLAAGNITIVNTRNANTDLALLDTTGNVSVTSARGITDSGTLTVGGILTLTPQGAMPDITLDTATNDFGTVTFASARNVVLTDVNGLNMGIANVTGSLNITTNGDIGSGGSVTVVGTTTLTVGALHDIALNVAGTDFGGTVTINSARNVTLTDPNIFDIGASSISGNLNIHAGNSITQSAAISVDGTATFALDMPTDLTLDKPANNFNTVEVTGANNVTVVNIKNLDIGTSTIAGNLDITSVGVTQSGAVSVGNTLTIAPGGSVMLDNAGNDFVKLGTITHTGTSVIRDGVGDLQATANISGDVGNLTIRTAGALTLDNNIQITETDVSSGTAMGNIYLVAGTNFINNDLNLGLLGEQIVLPSGGVSTGHDTALGRFLIYSEGKNDVVGGLKANFTAKGKASFDAYPPSSVSDLGTGFIFYAEDATTTVDLAAVKTLIVVSNPVLPSMGALSGSRMSGVEMLANANENDTKYGEDETAGSTLMIRMSSYEVDEEGKLRKRVEKAKKSIASEEQNERGKSSPEIIITPSGRILEGKVSAQLERPSEAIF